MPTYKAVLFDLDGTILDTSRGIINSIRYVVEEKKLPCPSESELRTFIGPPVQDSFTRYYGISKETAREYANIFRIYYMEYNLYKAEPYEGIMDFLKYLKYNNYKLGLATYKRIDYTQLILRHFGYTKYFDAVNGSDFDGILTKGEILGRTIEEIGLERPEEYVYVGDTVFDLKSAKENNVDFIGVSYGFGFDGKTDASTEGMRGCVDRVCGLYPFFDGADEVRA
jgi:phosphoglycolate phosphatase